MIPKFSIIIISYNSGNYLDRLFDCLDNQVYKDFETILIDNASPMLPPNEAQIKRADFYLQNLVNSGFAIANNQAANHAKGEYLVLLNPDAFPCHDWLFEIEMGIQRHSYCECFSSLQILDDDPNLLDGAGDNFSIYGIAWRGGHRKPIPKEIIEGEVFSACAAAAVWKKARFLELGGFEETFVSYYEDVDLGFRHRLNGGNCILLPKAKVFHKSSGSSSRYSDYAVFHGIRNREIAYVRLMPDALLWLMFIPHLAWVLLLWLHAFFRGAGGAYSKGLFAAVMAIPSSFSQRKRIQSQRKTKVRSIISSMVFSPIKLLGRGIKIMPIKGSAK